eukprot:CAMPEP_0116871248 /NCGR_PEP_ID=MMETSP0463-20121206/1504_1 /TAXON_ID=181622 /ORGANISM="Strombidinopsis sp, Strain SopsisLIS2011" /LENGTH=61 /DNA_ID=CAMNT_0004509291 /DNA_START=827 /DNA_END=1012 /DNA_ORIENTATION=-
MTWTVNGIKYIYKGDMLANVFHGQGNLTKSSGDSYQGEFENGKFNGEGEYLWVNKRLKYKG